MIREFVLSENKKKSRKIKQLFFKNVLGNPVYEEAAMRAMRALWHYKSNIGLVGNHVDVSNGKWTATDAGIGTVIPKSKISSTLSSIFINCKLGRLQYEPNMTILVV